MKQRLLAFLICSLGIAVTGGKRVQAQNSNSDDTKIEVEVVRALKARLQLGSYAVDPRIRHGRSSPDTYRSETGNAALAEIGAKIATLDLILHCAGAKCTLDGVAGIFQLTGIQRENGEARLTVKTWSRMPSNPNGLASQDFEVSLTKKASGWCVTKVELTRVS